MKRILTALLILCAAVKSLSADTGEDRFIWNEAYSRMCTARGERDFLVAAETYGKLSARGVRSSALFYNMGTALLLAGEYGEAERCLLRAERYSGTTWEIQRNIALALAGGDTSVMPMLPWYRYLLFWHYGLSLSSRMNIAIFAYSVFWLSLFPWIPGTRPAKRAVTAIALSVMMVFGSSAATTIQQEISEPAVTFRGEQ